MSSSGERSGPWWQIAQTGGARVFGLLVSTVTLAITARYLGPEGRGVVAAAAGWVAVLAGVAGLSLGQVVIYLAAGRQRDEWLPSAFGALLVIIAVATFVVWAGVAAGYRLSAGTLFNHLTPAVLAIAFLALPFTIWIDLGMNVLLALDALRVFNVAQVVGSAVQLAAIFLLVAALGWGVPGALGATLVSQALIAAWCLAFVRRQAPAIRPEWPTARRLLTGGAKLHLNAIGTILFTQANVILVNQFCTSQDTAYYQMATQLITVLQLLPVSISMVAYTIVARDGPDEAWREQRHLLAKGLGLMALAIVAGYVTAPWAIVLLAGRRFLPAVPVFRLLLPALIGMTFSIVMASQWIGRGLFIQAASLTFVTGVLTFVTSLALLPRFGVYGAVYAVLLVYGVSILANGAMALWVERRWRLAIRVLQPEQSGA